MPTLLPAMLLLRRSFAPRFSRRVWMHVQALLVGAILAPAHRTVAAALRVMGLGTSLRFQRYHRVLNRDRWSPLAVSRVLLGLLVTTFAASGPLVLGVDETIERRRGAQIAAKGMYRDAVRSSHAHFVKTSGLRWICLMLLVPIPWAARVWALPFLTALAPSERATAAQGRRHKTPTDWARQLLRVVRRWYPARAIVAVADSGYAALSLLAACAALATSITMITRLRLDAALYAPAPPRQPKQNGRPRVKGGAPAHPRGIGARSCDQLANGDGDALVWAGGTYGRTGLGHGRLVPRGHAGGADPLGADPRSPSTLRDPGAAVHRSVRRSWRGSCCAGRWKRGPSGQHLRKCDAISGSRRSANGAHWRLPAPRLCCSDSLRS